MSVLLLSVEFLVTWLVFDGTIQSMSHSWYQFAAKDLICLQAGGFFTMSHVTFNKDFPLI